MCIRGFRFISEFYDWICSQKSQLWHMSLLGNYPYGGKKMKVIPTWWEESGKIPAWREKFNKGLILYDRRKMWRLMCFISTEHFMCHSYKALIESKENKETDEPKDRNGMQVWLANVPFWVLKRNGGKVLPYVKR